MNERLGLGSGKRALSVHDWVGYSLALQLAISSVRSYCAAADQLRQFGGLADPTIYSKSANQSDAIFADPIIFSFRMFVPSAA